MAQPAPNGVPSPFDLDNQTDFSACFARLRKATTSNFAVLFDADQARCTVDLTMEGVEDCLVKHSSQPAETLWLNFWADEIQKPIIDCIALKYGLSPRLSSLLCPQKSRFPKQDPTNLSPSSQQSSSSSHTKDVEKGISTAVSSRLAKANSLAASSQISFGDVVNDLWHFESVDWGQRYLYVGFNALFSVPGLDHSTKSNKPSGQRIWTSLLFCDDGTIVSIFERPPRGDTYEDAVQSSRRNVYNIFRHLSVYHMHDKSADALMKVKVRPDSATTSATESACLIFYYLFDDWITTYALIARREHPYRDTLEALRGEMSESADVKRIESLHSIGRQLTVLKLMYKSYEQIVMRILQRQRAIKEAQNNQSHRMPTHHYEERPRSTSRSSSPSRRQHPLPYAYSQLYQSDNENMTVRLHPSATMRFERLLDRIRLYALTEIEECLNEKESLVFMTFNLVALKESQAVEKLTRTTIVLAKATILFLPVSLMTTYFSIQVGDLAHIYSLTTYWVCFGIVAVLSFLFLVAFGLTTNTIEGKTVYRSLGRMLWEKRSKATKIH